MAQEFLQGDNVAFSETVEGLQYDSATGVLSLTSGYVIPGSTEWTDLIDGGETTLHIHDGRYYTETEIDTMLGDGTIDHGNLSGLGDDDHTQYWSDVASGFARTASYTTTGTVDVGALVVRKADDPTISFIDDDGTHTIVRNTGENRYDFDQALNINGRIDCGDIGSARITALASSNQLTAKVDASNDFIISCFAELSGGTNLTSKRGNIIINSGWTAAGKICDDLGTVTTATSITTKTLTVDNTGGTDAVLTMDGSSNDAGTLTYESDNTKFIFDKGVGIGTATDMLAPLGITGDTASIEDRHEGIWIRGKTGAYIVQVNVRGPRLEIGGGASLDATPAMSVNYLTGHVGIGTTTPDYILDIDAGEIGDDNYDGLRIVDTGWQATSHPMLEFYNSHASFGGSLARIYGEIGNAGTNSKLYFAVADSSKNLQDRMVIDKSGKVGIGTTSPNYLTDFVAVDNAIVVIRESSGTVNDTAELRFATTDNVTNYHKGGVIWQDSGDAGALGSLSLCVNIASSNANVSISDARLTINKDGETLIGNPGGSDYAKFSTAAILSFAGTAAINGLKINTVAKTANYTATATDDVITCGAGNETFQIDLPTPVIGKVFHIKNVGTGTITVDANATGSTTIDGANTAVLTTQYECITIICDASVYWIL